MPPRIRSRAGTPWALRLAIAATAWCQRLSGLKRPILKSSVAVPAAARMARTWTWLTAAISERLGQAALDLAALALLALVDPEPVEAADPLRPPVQHRPAVQQRLLPRKLRISDEEEMGLVPPLGQRP